MAVTCENTEYDQMRRDYQTMSDALGKYKQLGGVVPNGVATTFKVLDQAYIAGDNFDAAFKSACLEMGNFLATNEEYCARVAGFADKADLAKNGGVRWQERDEYDICMLKNYFNQTQAEAVKKVLNIGDPTSFAAVFTAGTKKQIWDLLTNWLGSKVKESLKKSQ